MLVSGVLLFNQRRSPMKLRVLSLFVLILSSMMCWLVASGSAGEKVTVLATSEAVPKWEIAAEIFTKKYGPKVEIVSTGYPQSHAMVVTSQQAGSTAYDIAKVDTIWVAGFADAGYLIPLDDLVSKEQWQDTIPISQKAMTYKGKIWALGGAYNSVGFYYNEKLLKKAGFNNPPRTMIEMVEQTKVIQQKKVAKYGTAWDFQQYEGLPINYIWILNALGGRMQDDKGMFVFADDKGVQALQFMVDQLAKKLADPASISFENRGVVQPFIRGDVPFMFNWGHTWSFGKDPAKSQIVNDIRIALVPQFSKDSSVVSSSVVGGSGHGILKNSKNKDLAWKLLEVFTSPEVDRRGILELNSMTAARISVLNDPAILKEHPELKVATKQLEYAVNRPALSWYTQFSSTIQSEIQRALVGSKTAKDALVAAQGLLNDFVKIYGN
jgi:multiple sugar transport system substrate-binding protein